jgi:hypothetical protein
VFRDRCVDPLECFSLLTNEPDLNPLPVPSDSVLLLVTLVNINRGDVNGNQFADDVEKLVKQLGFEDVSVSLFATLEAEDGSAVIVLRFEGGSVAREGSPERLVGIMMDNPSELNHDVAAVRSVGEERPEPNESSDSDTDSSLSGGAIAGVVTVAAVASVMVVAVALAAVVYLVSKTRTSITPGHSKAKEVGLETLPYGKLSTKEELT